MKIALVTACIAGVAQSKMAAAALKKEAQARSIDIVVEEQGGHKIPKKMTNTEIADADVVIFAKAVAISGKARFKDKKILDLAVGKALRDPRGTINKAIELAQTE